MNIDELKDAFQSLDRDASVTDVDIDQIRDQVSSARRMIHFRDLREVIACGFVIVLFGPVVFMTYPVMTRMGAGVTCLAALFIGTWLFMGSRRHRAHPELSVDEFLCAEIAHFDYQIWLLRNVSWWYLAPLAIGFLMFVWGTTPVFVAVAMSAGYYLFDRFINWLNQLAVQKQLVPQRENLARARHALNDTGEPNLQSNES